MGFDMLYRVEVLTREGVADWCPPAHAPNADRETSPPDIALCTLESYEQVFFGGAYHPLMLRAFQRSLEVVIVERLDQLVQRDHVRLHLPFVLDKHRLMLRTEHRAMQLLLTAAPVGARPQSGADRALIRTAPRRKLAERFFGGDGGLDAAKGVTESENAERRAAHAQYLRPRSGKCCGEQNRNCARDADHKTWGSSEDLANEANDVVSRSRDVKSNCCQSAIRTPRKEGNRREDWKQRHQSCAAKASCRE